MHKCTHIHTYTYIYILYADSNSIDRCTDVCKQHSIGVGEAHVLGSGEIVGPKHEQLLSINASSVIAGGVVIYKDKKNRSHWENTKSSHSGSWGMKVVVVTVEVAITISSEILKVVVVIVVVVTTMATYKT